MKLKRIIRKLLYLILSLFLMCLSISQQWEIRIGFENFAKYLYPNDDNRNAELLKILLTVIGGIGILYSLYLAYKRAKATDKGLELQAEAINKQSEQLELSRKGQVNDRFKNAIEHLGNDKQPIILGGVVELHQIAKEEKEKYAAVVFNILTSYLRSVLKVDIPRDDNFSSTVPQTIIDFLFRGNDSYLYDGLKANLAHCNFLALDINESNFNYADFGFSLMPMNIVDVSFENAKFGRANFTVTNIVNTKFNNAEFHDTIFIQSEIKNSDFLRAKLSTQIFINTRFFDCAFSLSNIYSSNFLLCHFENTYFIRAELLSVNFWGCNFVNADFSDNPHFSKVDFLSSGFSETTFGSQCFECNFSGVRLKYHFNYIQPEDLKENINRPVNNDGIKELPGNIFLNCRWETFTQNDYDLIVNDYETSAEKWEQKYKPKKSENLPKS